MQIGVITGVIHPEPSLKQLTPMHLIHFDELDGVKLLIFVAALWKGGRKYTIS